MHNAVDGAQRPLISLDAQGAAFDSRQAGLHFARQRCPQGPRLRPLCLVTFPHYVHSSSLFIRRRTQFPGLVEYGKTAWTALQMVDAVVDDPTDGTLPPIVYATLHA